jgi:predicted nuclease with TOPRIM domain
MEWREFIMDNKGDIIQALITFVGLVGLAIWTDVKGWRKVKDKIGMNRSDTLEGQHYTIEKVIIDKTDNLIEFQDKEFTRFFNKVDNVNGIVLKSEARYENLNLDQRNIKDTMDKLLNEWQNLSNENNRLKEKNRELQKELERIKEHNRNLRKDKSHDDDWQLE